MQITNNCIWGDAKQALKMLYSIFEGEHGLVIFHIADVMTDKGITLAGNAEGIFQFWSSCQ